MRAPLMYPSAGSRGNMKESGGADLTELTLRGAGAAVSTESTGAPAKIANAFTHRTFPRPSVCPCGISHRSALVGHSIRHSRAGEFGEDISRYVRTVGPISRPCYK